MKQGFVVHKNVLGKFCRFTQKEMYYHLKNSFNLGIDSYASRLSAEARSLCTYQLCLDERVISSLPFPNPILSSPPSIHVMCDELKIPNGYYGTAPHQDWASTQGSLDSVTVWIPLTSTKDNFPLEVIPESHRLGLLDGKMNGSVLEVECDESKFIPVDCDVGDVVVMSSFLVHRTGKGNGGFRMAASIRFDNADEPTWRERDLYSAQKRTVDRTIKWKPTAEQVIHGMD